MNLPLAGATNEWTKPTSGNWEEQAHWSLGILPGATQDIRFNNAGWKALAINLATAQNFPQSLRVKSLRLGAPADSFNTLLLTYAGYEHPLRTDSLVVENNSAVVMHASLLEVTNSSADSSTGNLWLSGSLHQGDFSGVKVYGRLNIGSGFGPGAYFLTNGTLAADSISIGGFEPGKLVQHGGFNNVGDLQITIDGEFELLGGEVAASDGITVGIGDLANYATFRQHGGNVQADTIINGHYLLSGGSVVGKMSVPGNNFQRVNGSVLQTGGTNIVSAMDLGFPNRFGGAAIYVLSNGVVRVDGSTTFRGGWFNQSNGLHTIASDFIMQGSFVGPGTIYAEYFLGGGTLSVGGDLVAQAAVFQQHGGSNFIGGELVLNTEPPAPPSPPPQIGRYILAGGILVVNDIHIGSGAYFRHTNGIILHSGRLRLSQGNWYTATGEHSLGPLQLTGASSNHSAIIFPNGASILRLANSSTQSWDSTAVLYITGWHGSISGGGETQLFFGADEDGLTSQQLAQIQFLLGENYPAKILATGEVVPELSAPPLKFTSTPDALILHWTGDYQLLSATNVLGPYKPILGATTPFTNPFVGPQRFFRLDKQNNFQLTTDVFQDASGSAEKAEPTCQLMVQP